MIFPPSYERKIIFFILLEFRRANTILGKIRIIQKKGKFNPTCSSERLNLSESNIDGCFNILSEDKKTNNYINTPCKTTVIGEFDEYDNSGIIIDFDISDKSLLDYQNIWINSDSFKSIMIIINVYNINMNTIIIYRGLYENLGNTISNIKKINMLSLDKKVDGFLITSIILSLILLIMMLFLLRKEIKQVKKEYNVKCLEKLKKTFRLPSFFEWVTIINFLFYYGLIIFRYSYIGSALDVDSNQYIDFQTAAYRNELVTTLCAINLLLFYLILLSILNNYLSEFQIITKTITAYMYNLLPFSICVIFPYIMITMFISYFMYGDFYNNYYKNLTFIFLKVLQSFFRGTIDNKDYQIKGNEPTKIADVSPYINQYTDVVDKVGHSGYIIYSIISYFFSYVFVRGCIIGCCYLTYRNQYIQTMLDIAKKKKEEQIAERVKRREEEKKIQEEWVKKHLQQKTDDKEIEMAEI